MYLRGQLVSVKVDEDTNKDGDDGAEDAEQGEAGKLVDKLDTKEDNEAHEKQQTSAIHLNKKKIK